MTRTAGATLRVLTLNVQHAGLTRAQRQVAWLSRVAADVVVLTEVSAGASGDMTATMLRGLGLSVYLPDPADDRHRVLLAARGMLDPLDTGIAVMPHRFPMARIKHAHNGFEFTVAGLYVPSRGTAQNRNVAKRRFQDAVADRLPTLTDCAGVAGPMILLGDLNVLEPGHSPHYKVFGGWEYDFYRAFAAAGFVDAFRDKHPGRIEHSWFGRESPEGTRNGYRFDHTFITKAHRHLVHDCAYQHRPRHNDLSDHAAMTLTLHV